MNVAICDDSLSERRTIQEWITDYLGERPQLAGQLFLFENGKALLDAVKKRGGFDLYPVSYTHLPMGVCLFCFKIIFF